MKTNLTKRIMYEIQGTHHFKQDELTDYHAAQAVKAALRRHEWLDKLCGVRQALSGYAVTVWTAPGNKIEIRRDAVTVLIL